MAILFFETGSSYVTQAGLNFIVILPSASPLLDYIHVPSFPGEQGFLNEKSHLVDAFKMFLDV